MKSIYIVLSLLLLLLLTNCNKEDDDFSFGEPQTDFQIDTIYKTTSEGLLYVYFYGNTNGISISLLADINPELFANSWPVFTSSPRLTTTVSGAPKCWDNGTKTLLGSANSSIAAPDENLFSGG